MDNRCLSLIRIRPGRFSLLLVSIIFTFALRPFFASSFRINLLNDLFLSAIFISAILTVSQKKSSMFIALALAMPCLISKWLYNLADISMYRGIAEVFGALFIAYALISIASFISRQQQVDMEVIMAAVCGYFFVGLMWATVYILLESFQPGSYQFGNYDKNDQSHFIYFSFVTMTTVGYGDYLPVSNPARALAVLEAVMGQLYLAITIARLVGTYITQKQVKNDA